ncbi:major facilitator superfamily domain-containing protein [Aspergillus tetrazonus]
MHIEQAAFVEGAPRPDDIEEAKASSVFEANAVGYKEYREGLSIELTARDNSRVRWKIDLVVLPIFLVTQALQFMDKTALNYANLFGYQQTLGLHGQQFNYLSAMVYAGYFFGQYPCGWLVGRFPAQRVLGLSCLLWGFDRHYHDSMSDLLKCSCSSLRHGSVRGRCHPGLTLMTGFWYTRQEIPLRQCIWYSALGWGGIIGSYISFGISKLPVNFSPPRWELLFYILGAATCLWAAVIFFILPDSPSTAFFSTKSERIIAVKRVVANQTGIKNKSFDPRQGLVTLTDPKAILIFISVFAAAIPNGVVNSFSRIIIQDMGFSTTKTTQLKSVGDAVLIVALMIGGTITLNKTWARLACFWLVNTQSVGFTISLVTISSNMAGYTHRAMANALVFTAYCWGNFAGPFVVKPSEAPEYKGATIGLLVGYAIKAGCHLGLFAYMFLVNRHRDSQYGPADKARSDEAGMQDRTEFGNKDFRYVL